MKKQDLAKLPLPSASRTGWPWTEENPQLPNKMPNGSPWPRLSIVTPSYNQAQFLEETIRSVLLQGYPNLEYIIMDGGSTDGSVKIIHRYEPWLSYVHIGPDGGQAAAIAEGFKQATGDVLAWINSDDLYRPGAFSRAAQFFAANPNVALGSGDVNLIDVNGNLIRRIYAVRSSFFLTANLGRHRWPQQGCFWTRSAYEQVGGVDTRLAFCMDRDLFLRLARDNISRRIPGPPLADFRQHDLAKSSTIKDIQRTESTNLIRKYGNPRIAQHKRLLSYFWILWTTPAYFRALLAEGWIPLNAWIKM